MNFGHDEYAFFVISQVSDEKIEWNRDPEEPGHLASGLFLQGLLFGYPEGCNQFLNEV